MAVRAAHNLRRIVQNKAGWRLKITYPIHLRTKDSPENLCDYWFGVREYGSMAKALFAAITTRDQLEVEYNLSPVNWMKVTGLTHRVRFMDDRQRPLAVYRVSWRDSGKNRSKDFAYNINDATDKVRAYKQALKFNTEIRKKHYA